MTSDHLAGKTVLILCDHDALYAAIELELSRLLEAYIIRLDLDQAAWPPDRLLTENVDLFIVATAASNNDPLALLAKAALRGRVRDIPVLIISEQPSRPESVDKITYLNFPFDLDQLTGTVGEILDRHPQVD